MSRKEYWQKYGERLLRKQFVRQTGDGIVNGVAQKFKMDPLAVKQRVRMQWSAHVLTVELRGLNPKYLKEINRMDNELTMWVGKTSEETVRINYHGTNIQIEVLHPYQEIITMDQMETNHLIRMGTQVTLGLGLKNEPVRFDIAGNVKGHVMNSGATQSGKTNTQGVIIWNIVHNMTPGSAKIIIIDIGKMAIDWRPWSRSAALLHPITTDPDEAAAVLAWADQEITRRGLGGQRSPKIFLAIDELRDVFERCPAAASYLNSIARKGAALGVHLVVATQYPQTSVLGKDSAEMKRNIMTRLCGKVDDYRAANEALGIGGSGANYLHMHGDFLLKDHNGLRRLTVAKLEDRHVLSLPQVETVPELDLPDMDSANSGADDDNCVSPEHAALALTMPEGTGISKLAQAIKDAALAETMSKGKAKKVKEFADRQRVWIQENTPANEGKYFGWLNGDWREI